MQELEPKKLNSEATEMEVPRGQVIAQLPVPEVPCGVVLRDGALIHRNHDALSNPPSLPLRKFGL